MEQFNPIFFQPIYKDYLWGGTRILETFERKEPPGIYAESWEISDRDDGMSRVIDGPFANQTLHELVSTYPQELLGDKSRVKRFPLLLKLIDAHDNLSIQVHPNNTQAAIYGGEPKTEAWYILDAAKNAVVYAGFNDQYSKEEIDGNLPTRGIIPLMHTIRVKKGDLIFIPGGRLHAIGKGCLILEIQQNSNTTYRVYDWDRIDATGNRRPLQLDQARQVICYDDTKNPSITPELLKKTPDYEQWNLLNSTYFTIERWILHTSIEWKQNRRQFDLLFFQSGKGLMKWAGGSHLIKKGMTCLIPAASPPHLEIQKDPSQKLELLRFFTPYSDDVNPREG